MKLLKTLSERRATHKTWTPGHFFEWFKLLLVDEVELGDEVVEVLVAGVHVRLGSDGHHLKR
jgi:mannose/cellobiose epimerase-like protein (N-acyl-D-glucosamine 2-epimerase family)